MNWNTVLKYVKDGNQIPERRINKSDEEWREKLTNEEYRITREKGTESSGSSKLCHVYEPGIYTCVCCQEELFDTTKKFDSHSGWPSFTEPIKDNVISYYSDDSYYMSRVEVTCSTCDAHLGHVFPDGPEPTGLRFCINGISLRKKT